MPIRGHSCCSISCLRTHAAQTVELEATDYAYGWLMFNSFAIYVTVTLPYFRNMVLASSSFTLLVDVQGYPNTLRQSHLSSLASTIHSTLTSQKYKAQTPY